MADLRMFEMLGTKQTVSFQTGPNPAHDCFKVVSLAVSDVVGIFEEIAWTLDFGTGVMTHKGKRVIYGT